MALDHYISIDCTLSDLSGSEIEYISESLLVFIVDLSAMISRALNEQMSIEHQPVTVNVTKLNDIEIEILALRQLSDREILLKQQNDGHWNEPYLLTVRSYTNCTNDRGECDYITPTVIEWNGFEDSMNSAVIDYFEVNAINISSATFSVSNHSDVIPIVFSETESTDNSNDGHSLNNLLMVISAMIALVGVTAWCYQRGLMPTVKPRVDHSDWISWIALGLSFWDLVSDISLCSELWSERGQMDEGWQQRRVNIAAVGYTASTTIPFVCCMVIACTIKRRVKRLRNESASTWFVFVDYNVIQNVPKTLFQQVASK